VKIQVRVKPNSKAEEVTKDGEIYIIRVKEPPKGGKANGAVIRLLAEHFNVPRNAVRIASGLNSRTKVIEIAEQ
jgi:uncharacterized protein (TIGR00251 family)